MKMLILKDLTLLKIIMWSSIKKEELFLTTRQVTKKKMPLLKCQQISKYQSSNI